MPRSLGGGTYTLPALNPVTTGTVISSTWANNTLADIATELTNSLARSGDGGMSGPLRLEDGNSAVPSLGFNNETNSGLYRAGTNDVRVQVNATHVVTFTPAIVTIPVGLTVAQDTTDGTALIAAGNGAGAGLHATGGSSGGVGVIAQGGASGGTAITATGGSSDGYGIEATGNGTAAAVYAIGGNSDGTAIEAIGSGTGAGITATGGVTSGAGGAFTGGSPNGRGLEATGTGSGVGVYATGGATNAAGLQGQGTGTGSGITATGGATNGTGGILIGGATNGTGLKSFGTAAGNGVEGIGGTSNGVGGYFTGGAPNGWGAFGQGAGNGPGGKFHNATGSTAAGVEGVSNSAGGPGAYVSNGAGGYALEIHSGHAYLSGGNPARTDAATNILTPMNLVKSWGLIHSNGSGTYTIEDGFNFGGVTPTSSTQFAIAFQTPLFWDKYAVILTQESTGIIVATDLTVTSRATGGFTIKQVISGSVTWIHYVVLGAQ